MPNSIISSTCLEEGQLQEPALADFSAWISPGSPTRMAPTEDESVAGYRRRPLHDIAFVRREMLPTAGACIIGGYRAFGLRLLARPFDLVCTAVPLVAKMLAFVRHPSRFDEEPANIFSVQ